VTAAPPGQATQGKAPQGKATQGKAPHGWTLYEEALDGGVPTDLVLRSADGRVWPFPVSRWAAPPDATDLDLLGRCDGPTLDVGCGPGRLVEGLAGRGIPALGVDSSPAAVRSCLRRGGTALRRDLFDRLPGEGRWRHVLVIDGNVGIGGDPPTLLARVRTLLGPLGQAVVEVHPSTVDEVLAVRLEHPDGRRGATWRWARVGLPGLRRYAAAAGLTVTGHWHRSGRSFVELAR